MIKIDASFRAADDISKETLVSLECLLLSWKDTPYMAGVCGKGQGVDCARWCCSVLAEMEGLDISMKAVPQDSAFHDRETSEQAVREMMRLFWPVDNLTREKIIRPGYLVIEGPISGGNAHAMLAGHRIGSLWHSSKGNVVGSTAPLLPDGHEIKHILNIRGRAARWLN